VADRDAELPKAALRWLERAAPGGQAEVSHVAVSQRGRLESGDRWLDFRSEATYRPQPLAFEWRARLKVMLGIWVIASDGHANGEAWGGAKLWGLKTLGAKHGPDVLAAQLIRNIAELTWLPDIALADQSLQWTAAGDDAFDISDDAAGREVRVRFDLDSAGDIVRASASSRPYDVPEGFEHAPWRYELAEHREMDGVRIPTAVTATYSLPDGPWEYLRADVTGMQRFPAGHTQQA
jgi:hypothetical protein